MTANAESQLVSIATQLIGTKCWQVSAGGSVGSRFVLDFGKQLEWEPVENPRVNEMFKDKRKGELTVNVGCAAWRLDGEDEPITSWTDIAGLNGPMVDGLRLLNGCTVTMAQIMRPGLDLILTFDNKLCLRVFCDQFEEPYDNYNLSHQNTYVSVMARSRIVVS